MVRSRSGAVLRDIGYRSDPFCTEIQLVSARLTAVAVFHSHAVGCGRLGVDAY